MEINELIRELRHRGLHNGSTLGHHGGIYEVAADALEIQQKRIAELEKQQRWIPVTERKPEPGVRVLVTYGPFVGEAYLTQSGHFTRYKYDEDNWCFAYKATHWMPLPEPPMEGSK